LCKQCGKVQAQGGRVMCSACYTKYKPRYTYTPKDKFLFVCQCGANELTAVRNKKRCSNCASLRAKELAVKALRKKEQKAMEEGNCATCRRRPLGKLSERECDICFNRRKLRALERKERACK
jgi:hypothetical protein